jgi:hypothetical protein
VAVKSIKIVAWARAEALPTGHLGAGLASVWSCLGSLSLDGSQLGHRDFDHEVQKNLDQGKHPNRGWSRISLISIRLDLPSH